MYVNKFLKDIFYSLLVEYYKTYPRASIVNWLKKPNTSGNTATGSSKEPGKNNE